MDGQARARVLFVDDDPNVLAALAAALGRIYDIEVAVGGRHGLDILAADRDIEVVVSDMRMPGMDGASFLHCACEVAPDTTRVLLTGEADLGSAIAAVNEGQIFRLLTKPCPRAELRAALDAGIRQHRLVTAERDVLDKTLRGSIKLLIDVLALTKPAAFGRASRIKARVLEIAAELGIQEMWLLEVAALASQLGYISLPPDTYERLEHGNLSDAERREVMRAPELAADLLGHIPRLERVREILIMHVRPPKTGADRVVRLGAQLLRLALDIDEIESNTHRRDPMPTDLEPFEAEVVAGYERVRARHLAERSFRDLPAEKLRVGMTMADDIRLASGALLVPRGYEVTPQLIQRLSIMPHGQLPRSFRVRDSLPPGARG